MESKYPAVARLKSTFSTPSMVDLDTLRPPREDSFVGFSMTLSDVNSAEEKVRVETSENA